MWEASTARCVYSQALPSKLGPSSEDEEETEDDPRGLTYLLHLPESGRLATVTAEHNIVLYQLPALSTQQQVSHERHGSGYLSLSIRSKNICKWCTNSAFQTLVLRILIQYA